MSASRRRRSLELRVVASACLVVTAAVALAVALDSWLGRPLLAVAGALAATLPAAVVVVRHAMAPAFGMFRALAGTVTSYRDGDFSFSLRWDHDDELGDLVAAHNRLGDALRERRSFLAQRELLLDTMVQSTPVAMLVRDEGGRIVYGNLAARKLLGGGRRLEGQSLDGLFEAAPEPVRAAIAHRGDGLLAIEQDGEEEFYYLARSAFRLNGRPLELFVVRYATAELRRGEVRTWKKVIRVMSHELGNSLGPIASLAYSGSELLRCGEHEALERVFAAIAERARHLDEFLQGYARFARLPSPQPQPVALAPFLERLRNQVPFTVTGELPEGAASFDPAQLEQALLNLLRNAHESGSPPEEVRLHMRRSRGLLSLEVSDRGQGMTEAVLQSALLPFYSTKRGGTGLGLALVREIAEAHGGRVALANRDGGGLAVTVTLPSP